MPVILLMEGGGQTKTCAVVWSRFDKVEVTCKLLFPTSIFCLFFVPIRYSRSAARVREQFRDYFNSRSGEVSWQYNHIRRT